MAVMPGCALHQFPCSLNNTVQRTSFGMPPYTCTDGQGFYLLDICSSLKLKAHQATCPDTRPLLVCQASQPEEVHTRLCDGDVVFAHRGKPAHAVGPCGFFLQHLLCIPPPLTSLYQYTHCAFPRANTLRDLPPSRESGFYQLAERCHCRCLAHNAGSRGCTAARKAWPCASDASTSAYTKPLPTGWTLWPECRFTEDTTGRTWQANTAVQQDASSLLSDL